MIDTRPGITREKPYRSIERSHGNHVTRAEQQKVNGGLLAKLTWTRKGNGRWSADASEAVRQWSLRQRALNQHALSFCVAFGRAQRPIETWSEAASGWISDCSIQFFVLVFALHRRVPGFTLLFGPVAGRRRPCRRPCLVGCSLYVGDDVDLDFSH